MHDIVLACLSREINRRSISSCKRLYLASKLIFLTSDYLLIDLLLRTSLDKAVCAYKDGLLTPMNFHADIYRWLEVVHTSVLPSKQIRRLLIVILSYSSKVKLSRTCGDPAPFKCTLDADKASIGEVLQNTIGTASASIVAEVTRGFYGEPP